MKDLPPLLADILSREPGLRLAMLFGSFAQGTAAPDSDVDVAVLFDRPLDAEQKMRLIEKLADRTERAVDLVDLHRAGEPLLGQVLKGRRLIGADSDYTALTLRHLYDQEDFLPYIDRMLAERRRAWIGY
jgi:predicted nucleotidyltransferase